MRGKPSWNKRVEKAKEQLKIESVSIEEIESILLECLKEKKIDGVVKRISLEGTHINYEQISEKCKTSDAGHLIWIVFLKDGHVAVVGAGKDIGFPTKGKIGTGYILDCLRIEGKNVEWNKNEVIIIPIKGLTTSSVGIPKDKEHYRCLLECRNGVEHCIGEYLLKNNVPIINLYSHKNYSDSFWNTCENNGFLL